jgi:hypothetical protein
LVSTVESRLPGLVEKRGEETTFTQSSIQVAMRKKSSKEKDAFLSAKKGTFADFRHN